MLPREVFGIDPGSIGQNQHTFAEEILFAYWDVEMAIADSMGAGWTNLDLQDPDERTCTVCSKVHCTTESGFVPSTCDTPYCASVRKYFGLGHKITMSQFSRHDKETGLRRRVLEHRISKLLGTGSTVEGFIYKNILTIPKQIRFDVLLTTMLERMVHEKDNRRAA